jgi:ubiquinone/menaquinone biosynthesis C-methylase UbiE
MDRTFSYDMYKFTEKAGELLPHDAHKIIKHRYQIAAKLSKEKIALEIGVGQEFGMQSIAKSASKYVGIEYSGENVAYLNQVQSEHVIIHGDAHAMPFSNSEFQIINALAMIYYLDMERFLKEARRVLSIDGTLFFCTSNKDAPGFVKPPFTTIYYSIPELNNLLHKNGFEAEFFGSFARYKENEGEGFSKFKVFVKNFTKAIINIFPNGDKLWKSMRNRHLGGLKKLPKNINDIELDGAWDSDFHVLENDISNTRYRVIYCIAKLKKKHK